MTTPAESTDPSEWLLTKAGRANPHTRVDDAHPGQQAWSEGNLVRPLIHGAAYFAELCEAIEATGDGDLIFFTDWQGDADERLTGEPGTEIGDVLARADERGVDVRGLVWRSHWKRLGFAGAENRRLGLELQKRGAEVLLDMRVRTGGSHHQKFVVIRHSAAPRRDIAYVGGIDLCHSRRDDSDHQGDPQTISMAKEYGDRPPWHDIQAAIQGPAVHDVETVFRERWEDLSPLSRNSFFVARDRMRGMDVTPSPLPPQAPPPSPVDGGAHVVQLLRTYPHLRHGRAYPFARGGERSVARGYTKALQRARRLVYIEDQYLWGKHVGELFTGALRESPELQVIAVVPMYPDLGGVSRPPQLLGRRRAMLEMLSAEPDRVAVYGIENDNSTPIYVHAKVCVVDDTWATIGSDNFNRRSWTHDSELSAVVFDRDTGGRAHPGGQAGYGRRLRLTLSAEHLDRPIEHAMNPGHDASLLEVMADSLEPAAMFMTYKRAAAALDEWHDQGMVGPRPPGRLRRLNPPELGPIVRTLALIPYLALHDPDGRPRSLRRAGGY